ncbi:stAR-related lipid transfer protein 7, mitochondrial-like [Acipenser ruthenus]|uniref:stAR-related lipid transfer protein 7, mitochondrial-like n=1 Tax=Acipenser ruthenus TaxID=7906 RepID=UPI002740AAD5|nr:stAR-related lipid transfer protein 7, mitochondrial-like [Acipenser ruthenus]
MFQSIPRKPAVSGLYWYCVNSTRLVTSSSVREGSGAASWLGKRVGWALCWLQRGLEAGSGERKKEMVSILASQCTYVTGQRLRRAFQIGELYSNLYSERSRRSLVSSLWRRFQSRHSQSCKLLAALAGVFMWEEERIRDEELQRCADDMKNIERLTVNAGGGQEREEEGLQQGARPWEKVMDRKNFRVWRRPIVDSPLYEYRVFGTYTDVTPRQFFNVQLDTEYRKKWDSLVIKLEVFERDEVSGSEIIHWVTHFPYPMYSRDYVYIRRYNVDVENNFMVLVSRAVEHPTIPESPDFVRVRSYQSKMVIKPHKSFDENGFDYLLTYSDDPQTVFPRYCLSWMVSSGMPDFLEKLHAATLMANNMELEVRDYISIKPVENKPTSNPERVPESSRSGQQQMEYA